jgi:transposase, IS30 family
MQKTYTHLTQESRELIFLLLVQKTPLFLIAKELGVHKSTISREIKRGIINQHRPRYLPSDAQKMADERSLKSRKQLYVNKTPGLRNKIHTALELGWSPEAISGRLDRMEHVSFCTESVYRHIYSREGVSHRLGWLLRRGHLTRHRKMGRRPIRTVIPNRVDISLRPASIESREEFGHWEGDTMYFKGHQPLATHVERKSRFAIAMRPEDLTGGNRAIMINEKFGRMPKGVVKTFTFDNGPEFSRHEDITAGIGAKVYFAKPYASWQKGSVENLNGNIRWYLSRKTDLNELGAWKLRGIIDLMNSRPKKCLGFRTPAEVFESEVKNLPKSCTSN